MAHGGAGTAHILALRALDVWHARHSVRADGDGKGLQGDCAQRHVLQHSVAAATGTVMARAAQGHHGVRGGQAEDGRDVCGRMREGRGGETDGGGSCDVEENVKM